MQRHDKISMERNRARNIESMLSIPLIVAHHRQHKRALGKNRVRRTKKLRPFATAPHIKLNFRTRKCFMETECAIAFDCALRIHHLYIHINIYISAFGA